MAPTALDNANPTILSASQLPTRQKKAAPRKGPDTKFDDALSRPAYLSRPFCDVDVPWARGDVGDDGFADEAIDEQEIYGTQFPMIQFRILRALFRTSLSNMGRLSAPRGS